MNLDELGCEPLLERGKEYQRPRKLDLPNKVEGIWDGEVEKDLKPRSLASRRLLVRKRDSGLCPFQSSVMSLTPRMSGEEEYLLEREEKCLERR